MILTRAPPCLIGPLRFNWMKLGSAHVVAKQGLDPLNTLTPLESEKELDDAMGLNLQLGDATER